MDRQWLSAGVDPAAGLRPLTVVRIRHEHRIEHQSAHQEAPAPENGRDAVRDGSPPKGVARSSLHTNVGVPSRRTVAPVLAASTVTPCCREKPCWNIVAVKSGGELNHEVEKIMCRTPVAMSSRTWEAAVGAPKKKEF